MTSQSHASFALIFGLFLAGFGCGQKDDDEPARSPGPLLHQMPAWYAGQPPLDWFVTKGTFESPCLKADPTSASSHYKRRIAFEGLKLSEVMSHYADKDCKKARLILGHKASLSKVYREEPDTRTGLSYIVYEAEDEPALIRNEVYLDQYKADKLNRYGICQRTWFPNQLNRVLGLSEEECRAALDDLPAKDKANAEFLMQGILPHEEPASIHLVFHPIRNALSVKMETGELRLLPVR